MRYGSGSGDDKNQEHGKYKYLIPFMRGGGGGGGDTAYIDS